MTRTASDARRPRPPVAAGPGRATVDVDPDAGPGPADGVAAGGTACRSHPAADLDAVQPGQADVEDDGDGVQPADCVERVCAVALDVHPEALPAQVEPDEVGDGPIVLDDEDEAARFGVGSGHGSCLSAWGG